MVGISEAHIGSSQRQRTGETGVQRSPTGEHTFAVLEMPNVGRGRNLAQIEGNWDEGIE